MRLVQTRYLKEGDIIAKDIIGYGGGVLLRHNTRFREVFRNKLLERNIFEVYIEDQLSKGIEPMRLVSGTVKEKMCHDIREQFDKLKESLVIDSEAVLEVVNILMENLSNKEMVIELEELRANDNATYEHCIGVAILSNLVCNKLDIKSPLKEQIIMGALIHDIGKIIIPKDILNKPGQLTQEEYELVQSHVEIGYNLIKDNHNISAVTKLAVLCHHEREDGTGYPLKKGTELHISAKIVGACDFFHALISDRCYRQGLPVNEVIKIARQQPINDKIREVIENSLSYYPVGCTVQLSDGKVGIVEQNHAVDVSRPIVRIIEKQDNQYLRSYKVNLMHETNIYIVGRYGHRI